MNEDDYILATNLAKIRIARGILVDIVPGSSRQIDEKKIRAMISQLYDWEVALHKSISGDDEDDDDNS